MMGAVTSNAAAKDSAELQILRTPREIQPAAAEGKTLQTKGA